MTIHRNLVLGSLLALVLASGAPALAAGKADDAGKTKCDLTFSLSAWAAVYEHATGTGTITCDNGQTANVTVTLKGGGLAAGKFRIDGKGEFSKVHDIADLYGGYAAAEGNAGVVKAGEAALVTKGDVTLGVAGHGEGWNVGVAIGKLTIARAK